MAMRNNRMSVPAGPAFTDLFSAASAGARVRALVVSCASDSAVAMEYRVDEPADPAGEAARLEPGEAVSLEYPSGVGRVSARGVAGVATGGVEVRSL